MNLAIVTPFWGRPELSEAMMRHTREVAPDAVLIAVLSPEDPDERALSGAAARHDWNIERKPNQPLGAKWNAGLDETHHVVGGIDAVMILGSDDFVSPEWVTKATRAIEAGMLMAGLTDFYALRLINGRLYHVNPYPEGSPRHGETIGSGRIFSAELLDAVSWKLWPEGQSAGLDYAAMQRLHLARPDLARRTLALSMDDAKAWLVDARTMDGISTWPSYVGMAKDTETGDAPLTGAADTATALAAIGRPTIDRPDADLVSAPVVAMLLGLGDLADLHSTLATAWGVVNEWVCVLDSRSASEAEEWCESIGFDRVERREWTGFADQRNYADSLCSHPWRFIIDADELLTHPGNLREAIEAADAGGKDAVGMVVNCLCTDGSVDTHASIRAYRADAYEWTWPVHNELVRRDGAKATPETLMGANAQIEASYVGTGAEKAQRAIGAIEMWRHVAPDHPRWDFYLSRAYAVLADAERSLDHASKCAVTVLGNGTDPWAYASAWNIAARACIGLHDLEGAEAWAEKGIDLFPEHPDIRHVAVLLGIQRYAMACQSRAFAGAPLTTLRIAERIPQIMRLLGAEVTG